MEDGPFRQLLETAWFYPTWWFAIECMLGAIFLAIVGRLLKERRPGLCTGLAILSAVVGMIAIAAGVRLFLGYGVNS